jgi:hypothetical protein
MIDLRQRYPAKPILNPERIAVMIPTRKRVGLLRETIASFLIATQKPDLMTLWIAIDEDDAESIAFIDGLISGGMPFSLRKVVLPRQPTLSHVWNLLWQAVDDGPGFYLGFVDDYLMLTKGWDDAMRHLLGNPPAGLGIGQITDPSHDNPEMVTIVAATAAWFNHLGYFMPPYFPFWFSDVWHDQIAVAAGLKFKLPLKVASQIDKTDATMRMRDLGFWYKVFAFLAEERLKIAKSFSAIAYGTDLSWYDEQSKVLRESNQGTLSWANACGASITQMENKLASKTPWSERDEAHYNAVKSAVIDYLGPEFTP